MNFTEYEKNLKLCAACPKMCAPRCPSFRYSRHEKEHHTGLARLALKNIEEAQESFYRCSGCELCQEVCELKVPVLEMLFKGRALLWQKGHQPDLLTKMTENLLEFNHPFHKKKPKLSGRGSVLFSDCLTEHFLPHLLPSLPEKVEERLPHTSWIQGFCCGFFLLAAGAEEAFISYARKQARWLSSLEKIYISSSECAYCLKVLYKEKAGVDIKKNVQELFPLWVPAQENIYHRSCFAKKAFGQQSSKEYTIFQEELLLPCPGAGAFSLLLDPDTNRARAHEWAYNFKEMNGKKIITDCASAKIVLKEIQNFLFFLEL